MLAMGPRRLHPRTAARALQKRRRRGRKRLVSTCRLLLRAAETKSRRLSQTVAKEHIGALLVSANPLLRTHNDLVVALAARYRIPTSYESTLSTSVGGLMSYGTDLAEVSRLAGVYTGRILKGGKTG
jgi:hypothetical protein